MQDVLAFPDTSCAVSLFAELLVSTEGRMLFLQVAPREFSRGGEEGVGCFASAKNTSNLRWAVEGGGEGWLVFPRLAVPWERLIGVDEGIGTSRAGHSSSFALKGRCGDLEMSDDLREFLWVVVECAGTMVLLAEDMMLVWFRGMIFDDY